MIDLTQELVRALASPEVNDRLSEIVRRAVKDQLEADHEPLLTTEQAAQLLTKRADAIRKLAERGSIPCERVGRQLRFRRSALLPGK